MIYTHLYLKRTSDLTIHLILLVWLNNNVEHIGKLEMYAEFLFENLKE
jgi:hypothetical protein